MSASPRSPISIPGFTDPVSCWTHLLASGVALVAGVALVRRSRGSAARVTAVVTFVACTVFMFAMSGVYHLLDRDGAGRAVLQRLDHAGIFAMIAGTFTGLHGALFRGPWRWAFILALWVLAATGITLKTIFFATTSEALGLALYLSMGWLGLVSFVVVRRAAGAAVARLILIGGAAYSAGAIIEFARWPDVLPGVIGPHEIFHFCVIAGVAWHWRAVALCVELGRAADAARTAPTTAAA
jgi:channel protein (hemolysin III family)